MTEEKNLRTGFGRLGLLLGVGNGVGETVAEVTGKGSVSTRFAVTTMKSTQPIVIKLNKRAIPLLSRILISNGPQSFVLNFQSLTLPLLIMNGRRVQITYSSFHLVSSPYA